jgi:hypothetical protein
MWGYAEMTWCCSAMSDIPWQLASQITGLKISYVGHEMDDMIIREISAVTS